MIGFYRLPTHRRDAHMEFFSMIPSYFKMEVFIRWFLLDTTVKQMFKSESISTVFPLAN